VDSLITVVLVLYGLAILYPFYNSILVSLVSEKEYMTTPFMLFPKKPTLLSYRYVFSSADILNGYISTLVIVRQQQPAYSNVVETVTTPYGARTNFKLPDGSEVWLNSGTTISFPRQYGETRNVELSGQAYFYVVKDGKPFVVKTGFGSIEVMGTSFDAKAYANDNFETTLVEGSVKIVDGNNRTATLKPGQQATITPDGEFSLLNVNTGNITSWREGKLVFIKTPFVEVAKDLERWYNVKIELQGERLKKIGYTGTIELETFGEVLELINVTTPIKYSFNKNTRILKISGR
jgi:ferric-dicitrate binding protein FerR (iron transport regulator)